MAERTKRRELNNSNEPNLRTDEGIEALKKSMLQQRSLILNQLNSQHPSHLVERVEGADELDAVVTEQCLSVSVHLHERERRLLKELDHALSKFDNASIGVCEACSATISPKRLWARPIARYCVSCQEDQEERHRNYA